MNSKLLLSLGILLALVVSLVLAIPAAAQEEPQLTQSVGSGSTLFEGDIPVSVQVSNFNIVDKIGEAAVAGEGHLIYYYNTPIPTNGSGIPDSGIYQVTAATSIVWPNVTAGTQTFGVQLVNNDDTPLDPPVTSEMIVVVNALQPVPTLAIITPASGATLVTRDVPVSIVVSGFNIVDKLGQDPVQGEGHVIYYLDGEVPATIGEPALGEPGFFAISTDTSFTWTPVTPGNHVLGVQLVNNDNTPLDPPVIALVQIAVEPQPILTITSPADGASLASGDISVSIQVSDFNIVNKQGEAAVSGEGHMHYYLDTEIPIAPGEPAISAPGTYISTADTSVTWQNAAPGAHTLGVQLVNNDHTPLDPPVYATVTVTVQPAPAAPVSGTNWWLAGGLIAAGIVILGLILYFSMRRRETA